MCDIGRAGLRGGRMGAVGGISGNGGKDAVRSMPTRLDAELELDKV